MANKQWSWDIVKLVFLTAKILWSSWYTTVNVKLVKTVNIFDIYSVNEWSSVKRIATSMNLEGALNRGTGGEGRASEVSSEAHLMTWYVSIKTANGGTDES